MPLPRRSGRIEVSEAQLTSTAESIRAWAQGRTPRRTQRTSVERLVLSTLQPRINHDRHRRWIDADQITVEQRMEVCAKQEPVLHLVGLRAAVRVDMGRFEHVKDIAATDRTASAIGADQCIPESTLATAQRDRSDRPLARILDTRYIESSPI